jgi:hypothetical protein
MVPHLAAWTVKHCFTTVEQTVFGATDPNSQKGGAVKLITGPLESLNIALVWYLLNIHC